MKVFFLPVFCAGMGLAIGCGPTPSVEPTPDWGPETTYTSAPVKPEGPDLQLSARMTSDQKQKTERRKLERVGHSYVTSGIIFVGPDVPNSIEFTYSTPPECARTDIFGVRAVYACNETAMGRKNPTYLTIEHVESLASDSHQVDRINLTDLKDVFSRCGGSSVVIDVVYYNLQSLEPFISIQASFLNAAAAG